MADGIEIDCPNCGGTSYINWGAHVIPGYVFATYKIVEATIASEYSALSTANKTAYGMIVSLGTVDLSDGTATKDKLWDMFGAETTTRANLETLVA